MDPLTGTSTPPPTQTPSSPVSPPDVIRLPADNPLGLPTELPNFSGAQPIGNEGFNPKHAAMLEGREAPKPVAAPIQTPVVKPAETQTPTDKQTQTVITEVDTLDALTKGLSEILGEGSKNKDSVKPSEVTPVTNANNDNPNTRSYEGLNAAETVAFKQMSRPAYELTYPAYLKAKKLQADIEELKATKEAEVAEAGKARFYDHEDAYTLDPEIRKFGAEVEELTTLEDHYTAQLEAIEGNKPWHAAVRNEKGELVQSPAYQPDIASKVKITRELQNLAARKMHVGALANQRIQSFKNEFQEVNKSISDVEKSIFGPFEAILAPARDKFLERFPKAVRGKPEIKALASTVIALSHALQTNNQLSAKLKAPNLNAGAMATGTPTSEIQGAGSPGADPKDQIAATVAAMEKLARGY
jgi:hypothetical protein